MFRSATLGLLLLSSSGWSRFKQLRLDPVLTSFQKPSNVAVVAVTQHGKSIGNLQPGDFRIYDNGRLSSAKDTQRLVLPQALAAYHHTLLLVDVSGEGAALESLSHAVAGFVENVRSTQAVSVFAFDGRPQLRLAGEFPRAMDQQFVDLRALTTLGQGDTRKA